MDELTNSIHTIEMCESSSLSSSSYVSLLTNISSTNHPRFSSLYKQTQFKSNQEERRKSLLNQQKQRRSDVICQMRNISSKKESKREHYNKRAPYTLMFSEWLEEEPEDFKSKWIMVLCPVGKRCLVVALDGVTTVYNKAGKIIARHRSALPGGYNESKVDETILDCIYDDSKRTYFVLDCLVWKSHPIIDTETRFRFYWLNCKLQEAQQVTQISKINPYKFENVPRVDGCTQEAIQKAVELKNSFQLDGLLFYHAEAHYTQDHTPLVLWLKVYMLQEILGISVTNELMRTAPSDYINARNVISSSNEDIKRFKSFLQSGNTSEANDDKMDVCYGQARDSNLSFEQ